MATTVAERRQSELGAHLKLRCLTQGVPAPIFGFCLLLLESGIIKVMQAQGLEESGAGAESVGAAARAGADERWMRKALAAAREAAARGEVPVGACVVSEDGELLAVAGNRTRTDCDPTAHAEVVALRAAARRVGNFRLTGALLYATIEPCAMCAGALVQARVRGLVYGARDARAGAVESVFRICDASSLNHRMELTAGVLEAECRELMQTFFRARRIESDERRNTE